MDRITLTATVSDDGMLHVPLPAGSMDAGQDVQVTVESVEPGRIMTRDEWQSWVRSMAGSWKGDFERPPQGEYEQRDPLS